MAVAGLSAVLSGVLRASCEDSRLDLSSHTSQGPVWSKECQMFLNTTFLKVAIMSPKLKPELENS